MGQGTIPDDWLGEYCRYAVCWPNSEQWLAVLRGVLTLPARGRFWDEHTGNILEAQSVIRETFDTNLHLQGVIMACNDTEMVASFNAIASAIRYAADRDFAKACCELGGVGSGGIVGIVTPPVSGVDVPIYGTQPPAELPPGETFPEGFESLEEWDTHKCSVANVIMDGVIATLQGLATLNLLNVNVLGVLVIAAVSGFLVFPPSAIPVMVATLIALAASQALLIAAKNYLIDNREEWVCMLYGATSVSQLIGILSDTMDTLIAFIGTSGPIGAAVKLVLMLLFNGDALNQLFDVNADYQYPDADCSSCDDCPQIREYITTTTFNDPVDLPLSIDSFFDTPSGEWVIQFSLTFGKTIAVEDLIGWTDFPAENDFRFWVSDDFTGSTTFNSNDPPLGVIASSGSGVLISSTPFSATIVCVP